MRRVANRLCFAAVSTTVAMIACALVVVVKAPGPSRSPIHARRALWLKPSCVPLVAALEQTLRTKDNLLGGLMGPVMTPYSEIFLYLRLMGLPSRGLPLPS